MVALGAPASDAYQSRRNWTVEDFRAGRIYWNKTGAHEMHGGIYAKYKTLLQSRPEPRRASHRRTMAHPDRSGPLQPLRARVDLLDAANTRRRDLGQRSATGGLPSQWERGRLAYPTPLSLPDPTCRGPAGTRRFRRRKHVRGLECTAPALRGLGQTSSPSTDAWDGSGAGSAIPSPGERDSGSVGAPAGATTSFRMASSTGVQLKMPAPTAATAIATMAVPARIRNRSTHLVVQVGNLRP